MVVTENFERINNRFVQKIAEIRRLQEQIDVNVGNLKALALKQFDSGYTVNVDGVNYTQNMEYPQSMREVIDWYAVNSVIVNKTVTDIIDVEIGDKVKVRTPEERYFRMMSGRDDEGIDY